MNNQAIWTGKDFSKSYTDNIFAKGISGLLRQQIEEISNQVRTSLLFVDETHNLIN